MGTAFSISKMKRKVLLCIIISLLAAGQIDGIDFAFRLMPEVTVPLFDAAGYYTPGGGVTLSADVELFGFLAPFLEAGFRAEPTRNTGKSLLLASGGAGLGFFAYPIPRLKVRFAAAGGPYYGSYGKPQNLDYYWKACAEAGYRFSPGFTLSAGAQFSQYLYREGILHSGVSLGVILDVSMALFGARESGVVIEGSQSEPIFPLLYTSYEGTPVGKVRITNTEQAEIRNVEVSFLAGKYSSVPRMCARFPMIPRGETVEAPLHATLNEQVLSLTENTKVQAELIVTYSLLDTRVEVRKAQTIRFNHRNAATWRDDRMAAAFVSPNDSAVLGHSKYIAGLIRDRIRPGIDANLQYGMGFFESLRLSGITCAPDPNTPYSRYHADKEVTDYLQFPYQTLAYKSGDSDDLCILYAAALESTGIQTAFIPLADDFCMAFALQMAEPEARATFTDPAAFIYREDRAWLPLQVSLIREGFMAAWLGVVLFFGYRPLALGMTYAGAAGDTLAAMKATLRDNLASSK